MDTLIAQNPAGIIAALVSQLKPFLPARITGPTSGGRYAASVRLLALALGVIGYAVDYLINTRAATGPGLEHAAQLGLYQAGAAIAVYHLATANSSTTPTSDPAPAPPITQTPNNQPAAATA